MDLSSPLRSLVPSLDSAVLEVLAATESALSVTQVARLAGRGSRTGHQRVLERLVEHGIVIAEPANTGYLYRLNREHVLSEAIRKAIASRAEVLVRLTRAVQALDPLPQHVSIFGSFARREGREHSDIDLLLVMPSGAGRNEDRWLDQMIALEDRVVAWTGNRLESLVLSAEQLQEAARRDEPLVASLRSDALVLLGPDIDTLLTGQPAGDVSSAIQ